MLNYIFRGGPVDVVQPDLLVPPSDLLAPEAGDPEGLEGAHRVQVHQEQHRHLLATHRLRQHQRRRHRLAPQPV